MVCTLKTWEPNQNMTRERVFSLQMFCDLLIYLKHFEHSWELFRQTPLGFLIRMVLYYTFHINYKINKKLPVFL